MCVAFSLRIKRSLSQPTTFLAFTVLILSTITLEESEQKAVGGFADCSG